MSMVVISTCLSFSYLLLFRAVMPINKCEIGLVESRLFLGVNFCHANKLHLTDRELPKNSNLLDIVVIFTILQLLSG